MIIRGQRQLEARYEDIGRGDIVVAQIRSEHLKESVLVDLVQRGVHLVPSALCQVLTRSKIAQTRILNRFMPPHSTVITRRADLIKAVNRYGKYAVGSVVSKQNHMHCGHGIRLWATTEDLYNGVAFSAADYPFVLQPCLERVVDVRLIFVGDYLEAYTRRNPNNFRNNLSSGGRSRPYAPDRNMIEFCRAVIKRGTFPFAHIDLLLAEDGQYYLSEISLNGGIKGAQIKRSELDAMKGAVFEKIANSLEKKN